MKKNSISPQDFIAQLKNNPLPILDVREVDEYSRESIPKSLNHPLSRLKSGDFSGLDPQQAYYVICARGMRSLAAIDLLKTKGFQNLVNISGGMSAYKSAKGETICNKSVLPIMRQVQIVAGSLVLTGLILSHYIGAQWIYLSGFVACGLIFAGVSGLCPMAKLLEMLPWNQAVLKSCDSSASTGDSKGCCT